jgi:hypothetical protein
MNKLPENTVNTQVGREYQILNAAIQQLKVVANLELQVVEQEIAAIGPQGETRKIDALVRMIAQPDLGTYAVEVKPHLTIARLFQVAEQLRVATNAFPNCKGMLVTDYVNPNMAKRLKEMNIAFIDMAGNAYINNRPIYIYIQGNKPTPKTELGKALKPTRAFQATGLKVLFGFLLQPDLLQATYREIANATDVALGTVGWVLTDLREHGYILEKPDKERRLVRKRELLDEWVAAYPEKLRPKLRLGRYRAPDHQWWQHAEVGQHKALWGGEVAAAKLTDYLQPNIATIYADEIPARLLLENHLKKDPAGDVEILQQFWRVGTERFDRNIRTVLAERTDVTDVVPALLVYADLVATGDARNIETAKIIYDEYVDRSIQQD